MATNGIALVMIEDGYMQLALSQMLNADMEFDQVITCSSLEAAYELIQGSHVDYAVFTLGNGDFSNVHQLDAIREKLPTAKIAVLASKFTNDDVLAAHAVGLNGLVPFDKDPQIVSKAFQQIAAGYDCWPSIMQTSNAHQACVPSHDLNGFLTRRQMDVLKLLAVGHTSKMIGNELGLAEGTVKIHLKAIFKALDVRNRTAAVVAANRRFPDALAA